MNFADSVSNFIGRSTEIEPVVHRFCDQELDFSVRSLVLRASSPHTHIIVFDDGHLPEVAMQLKELQGKSEATSIVLVSPFLDRIKLGRPCSDIPGCRKFEFKLNSSINKGANQVTRAIDIACVLLLLAIWAPFHLVISLLILATSGRPVIYKQARIGSNQSPFTMLKYRSMRAANDNSKHQEFVKALYQKEEQPEYKMSDDNRITKVGALLRKLSIDEIPQLLNVLQGSMSLIGPRPCLDYEMEEMDDWHKTRFRMRPGMSGLWQVYGRSRCTIEQSQFLDSLLFHSHSITQHIVLILKTPLAVLAAKGAR